MSTARKIRWLIAHHPQELFVRTAKAFAEELNKHCQGDLEVEILTYPEYRARYHDVPGLEKMGKLNIPMKERITAFWNALENSDVEMSQVQVGQIGNLYSDFHALDLPFLFDDHDHANRVLTGEIGQELCRNLGEKSPVRGLAFTYSGGYRVIGSNYPIQKLDELKGIRVIVQNPLTLGTTVESMGAQIVPTTPTLWDHDDALNQGVGDAIETTYLRFHGKHILKTNHSMFLTTILVSNKFWHTLTEHQQDAFQKAARSAAHKERQWSIDDAAKYENEAEKNGVSIVEIDDKDRMALKQKSQITYVKCKYMFSDGLVHKIRTLH